MNLPRGGWSAIVGFGLLGVGFVIGFVGVVSVSNALIVQTYGNGVPTPTIAWVALATLPVAAAISGVTGVVLIRIGRSDRNREEDSYLDPLEYLPVRNPLRKARWPSACVVIVVLLFAMFALPVARPVSLIVPVLTCSGNPGNEASLTIPNGALLTYSWHSSNGSPVSLVGTPSGPLVDNESQYPGEFLESSAGWSVISSNGSTMHFYACDDGSGSVAPGTVTVIVTGTYYAPLG